MIATPRSPSNTSTRRDALDGHRIGHGEHSSSAPVQGVSKPLRGPRKHVAHDCYPGMHRCYSSVTKSRTRGATVRRSLRVLALLGGFLVVSAVLAQFWAPGQLMKTPIDSDTTFLRGDGTAKLDRRDHAQRVPREGLERHAGRQGQVHDRRRRGLHDLVLLVNDEGDVPGCVDADDPEGRLLSASTDVFATDRVTALAVNDREYLPADAEPHEGLMNKWPFDAEKKTYPYWDGTVGTAVDAIYAGHRGVDGIDTYVYKVTTSRTRRSRSPTGMQRHLRRRQAISSSTPRLVRSSTRPSDQQRTLDGRQQVLDLRLEVHAESRSGQRRRRELQHHDQSRSGPPSRSPLVGLIVGRSRCGSLGAEARCSG